MRHRDVVLRTAQVSALPDHLARGEIQRLEADYVPDEDQPVVDERLEVHPHVQRVADLLAPEPLATKGFEREYLPGHRSEDHGTGRDRKSTRLNSSHANISYAVFCLKKKLTSVY